MNIFCASGRYHDTEHTQTNQQHEPDDLAKFILIKKKKGNWEKQNPHIR